HSIIKDTLILCGVLRVLLDLAVKKTEYASTASVRDT
ncbi:hypothetical protein SAMN04489723_104345, partial [Algoriphagus aquimarinus]